MITSNSLSIRNWLLIVSLGFISLCLSILSDISFAEMYSWKDSKGGVHFSSDPPTGEVKEKNQPSQNVDSNSELYGSRDSKGVVHISKSPQGKEYKERGQSSKDVRSNTELYRWKDSKGGVHFSSDPPTDENIR